ncbi:MAG: ABC transporter ATP-binding protein [Leptolinea sp.]|jgi:ABC-2 type transport system ATP-binding protein|nr:ABC transporter ATP-binding protein [Leptolinea sp.]
MSNQTGSIKPFIPDEPIIRVDGLIKNYGQVTALTGISFNVRRGELFGFLGPNGAGKTTTINILTGLARADSGIIEIDGQDCAHNPKSAQHLIGIVPDESNLYPELSGFDNLCFCASLYGMKKEDRINQARQLLDDFGLSEAGERKFAGYSKGMKRKLTIAAGLIHKPSILFLDEPTTGIDVASARHIRQLIQNLHGNGTTIFLTTHYIEEAERLCDRIAFIVGGRIVLVDSVAHLLQSLQEKQVLLMSVPGLNQKIVQSFAQAFSNFQVEMVDRNQLRIEANSSISLAPLVNFLAAHNLEVLEARSLHPSLEDIFVKVTGLQVDMMKKEREKNGGGGQ